MTLAAGRELGPYRIVRQLGAGAMGVVYEAHDARLGRDVAIKVLPTHIARDEDMVARFEREVRAIAALTHPNVLAIYDIGQREDLIYAVMELVRGVTLRDTLAGGPLSHATVIDYTRQIALGLEAAHGKGIVHRDLKPENLLVSDNGVVKILDFGIAKFDPLGLGRSDHATLFSTMPGVVLGTLAYMAPEQLRGAAVDHRADLFSLGAILFEMLTGESPFVRETSAETIGALVSPDGPDARALASIPPGLADLVTACLAKAIAGRPDSGRQIAAHLDALVGLGGGPIGRTGVVSAGASPPPGGAPRSVAVLPFADMSAAQDQDYFCEGMADEIISTLAQVRGLRVVARTSAFRFKGQQVDVREIGRTLGVEAVLEGSVRTAGQRMRVTAQLVGCADGYQLWTERFDRDTTDVFAVQDDIARAVGRMLSAPSSSSEPRPTIVPPVRPDNLDVYTLYLKGRHHWSRRTRTGLEKSLVCFQQALDRDANYAQAWSGLADSYLMLGVYGLKPPADVMPLATRAARTALEHNSELAAAHASLACLAALYDWDWPAAERGFAQALSMDPNLASAYQWRAMHLRLPLGRFTEARADLIRAAELDPVSPAIGASLGLQAHFAGDTAAGLAALDRALELDATTPLVHFFRSQLLADAGRGDLARVAIGRALEHGGRTPEFVAAEGYARAVTGDRDGGDAAIAELAAMARDRYVSPVCHAQVHCGLGRSEDALAALEEAADTRAADLIWIAVRPAFTRLANEPRYAALMSRLRLDPARA